MSNLPERLRARSIKLRNGTNDQHTPGLLEEAAREIEALIEMMSVDVKWVNTLHGPREFICNDIEGPIVVHGPFSITKERT